MGVLKSQEIIGWEVCISDQSLFARKCGEYPGNRARSRIDSTSISSHEKETMNWPIISHVSSGIASTNTPVGRGLETLKP